MATTSRYATLVAILDDPLNLACVERELARRREKGSFDKGLLPPPTPREGGGGLVYLSMEEYQRNPKTLIKNGEEAYTEYLLDVFEGTDGWLVIRDDLSEIGPFPTLKEAQKEAENLLKSEGYRVLNAFPWGALEAASYPLTDGKQAIAFSE